MTTMWTPAPQRNVLRQQEYRRWVMTTERREKAPTPALAFRPVDFDRAADESLQMARRVLRWSAPREEFAAARPPETRPRP
jgi:hypothetical protein